MHHVTLDRPWPDNRHLNNDVVEGAGLQPRQHRHLRAGFDLERAQRVGLADHRVGCRVLGWDGRQVQRFVLVFRQQIERPPHAAQHAQAQHIDLHETQDVDVILVPFDDLPIGHAGGLDRHQIVQPFLGQHEAAGVLRHVPGKAHQFTRQIQGQPQPAVCHIEVQRGGVLFRNPFLTPAPCLGRQRAGGFFRQTQGLAHVANGAAAAIADDCGAQGGALPAIRVVDPLDHLLPPLMFEIHVNVGWFAAFGTDETFEQQIAAGRVDRGDPQHETHCRIGRRSATLAQDAL